MVSIKWTSQAVEDLEEIYFYIAKSSKLYAKRQIDRIRYQTNVLQLHPKSGKPVPEYTYESVREILVGRYRIIYAIVDENRVDILTVHHSSRDLQGRNIF